MLCFCPASLHRPEARPAGFSARATYPATHAYRSSSSPHSCGPEAPALPGYWPRSSADAWRNCGAAYAQSHFWKSMLFWRPFWSFPVWRNRWYDDVAQDLIADQRKDYWPEIHTAMPILSRHWDTFCLGRRGDGRRHVREPNRCHPLFLNSCLKK